MPQCAFCGEPAPPTREDVIPKWLQRHFDLWDQRLGLWNDTTLRYRQAVVPMCKQCNNVRFSQLETRIKEDRASRSDYYLWALKITYGLSQKDATLAMDQANPQAGPLLPRVLADANGALARHAFRALDSPDFEFEPDPFGSVISIPSSSDDFLFIEVPGPKPCRAVAVALPDRPHCIVLFDDRGVVSKMLEKRRYKRSLTTVFPELSDQSQVKHELFVILTFLSHLDIPQDDYIADGSGLRAPRLKRRLP